MKRLSKHTCRLHHGIALFVLMTAIAVVSLIMRELIQVTSQQATRVRNSGDRIQAMYLARSALNLSRFMLAVDRLQENPTGGKSEGTSDLASDLWGVAPVTFPLRREEIELILDGGIALTPETKKDDSSASNPSSVDPKKREEKIQKCEEFFEDFSGSAVSIVEDLSGRFQLNDLTDTSSNEFFMAFQELLKPTAEFLRHLNDRGHTAEGLAREIRDFVDADTTENDSEGKATQIPEVGTYTSMQLDYEPKNRPFISFDELKLLPHMDDFIFSFLIENTSPYYIPKRAARKVNINTANQITFQALLKNLSDAEEVAAKFIKDRKENKRVYTDKNYAQTLNDALQLNNETIRLNLITGASDSFRIETTAEVNRVQLKLTTIVSRYLGNKKVEPVVFMRISP